MKSKDLIARIDEEMDITLRRKENFQLDKIVDSYHLDEMSKPVVEEYLTNVANLYINQKENVRKAQNTLFDGLWFLDLFATPLVGAGIGAAIGYFVNGAEGAGIFAANGAIIGLIAGVFLRPLTIVAAYKNSSSEAKQYTQDRQIYRNKVIAKLDEVWAIPRELNSP